MNNANDVQTVQVIKPLQSESQRVDVTPKQWYHSKTVWFNFVTLLILVTEAATGILPIPDGWLPYLTFAVVTLNIVLRVYFTSNPIGTDSP